MAKKKGDWKLYRNYLSRPEARSVVDRLISRGKVWGKTVTTTNIGSVFTVWTKPTSKER